MVMKELLPNSSASHKTKYGLNLKAFFEPPTGMRNEFEALLYHHLKLVFKIKLH